MKKILVTSFKSGTGKSFIAMHLAKLLSKKGKTLFLDFSEPFGAIAADLNLLNALTIETIKPILLDPDANTKSRIKNVIASTDFGFDYILGAKDVSKTGLNAKQNKNLLTNLPSYDFVVQDSTACRKIEDLDILQSFDVIFCVLEQDSISIFNTNKFLNFDQSLKQKLDFVINKYEEQSVYNTKDIENVLGIKIANKIEYDKDAIEKHKSKFKLITDKNLVILDDLKNMLASIN